LLIDRENVIRQLGLYASKEILKMPGEIGKTGKIRQIRKDAQIGNVAPDIQKHFGYHANKTVASVLKENKCKSINELREKIKK